jgi:hypothetical protein
MGPDCDGVMGALIPLAGNGMPPARRALCALSERIADVEKRLEVLQSGRRKLESELSRVSSARAELDGLIRADAQSLADLVRSGAGYVLSRFAGSRAQNLNSRLSDSRLEAEVGAQALAAIDADIQAVDREVADLKAAKPDAIVSVMAEAAAGYRHDYAVVLDQMRDLATVLAGLEKIVGPQRVGRIVATVPNFDWHNGLGEEPVVASSSDVDKARAIWTAYAEELARDPLARVDRLNFPAADPHADDGRITYESLSPAERRVADIKSAGIRFGAN